MDSRSGSDRVLLRSTSIHAWRERRGCRALSAATSEGGYWCSGVSRWRPRGHVARLRGKQSLRITGSADCGQQLVTHPELLASAKAKLELSTPIFDSRETRIVGASSSASSSGSSDQWAALEEQALSSWDRKGKKPMRLLPDDKVVSATVGGTLCERSWKVLVESPRRDVSR